MSLPASASDGAPASKPRAKSPSSSPAKPDPVLRNCLRYTVSAKDYRYLHRYLISRSPVLERKAPSVARYEAIVHSPHDFNAAAVRASLRLFLASQGALKLWDLLNSAFLSRGSTRTPKKPATSLFRSRSFRLSLSLSGILLLHRLLHRFFALLRENILSPDARPFRKRNPRVSGVLASKLAPAVGASAAGFMLAACPSDQLRVSIAIYVFTRAAEFLYNKLEEDKWFSWKPWWFGSWLIMPISCGQLLHAFVFDRDCFPKAYGDFILNNTPNYIQRRPADYPAHLPWPGTYEIVDSLATMSKLNYPPFVSPILFPSAPPLPATLSAISPVISPAHPALQSLSCALLHPHDPSCLRTYITFYIRAFPSLAKFFTIVFTLFSLPGYRRFLEAPAAALDRLARSILRMTLFVTGSIGSSWGAICLFQSLLPRNVLPTQRWFLGGFLGGLWGFLERKNGRSQFLYTLRASIDSCWKVGRKRGWWRGVRNGDVWLFVASLAVINGVYEVRPQMVKSGLVRRGLGGLRGRGWDDCVVEEEREEAKAKEE